MLSFMVILVRPLKQNIETSWTRDAMFPKKVGTAGASGCYLGRQVRNRTGLRKRRMLGTVSCRGKEPMRPRPFLLHVCLFVHLCDPSKSYMTTASFSINLKLSVALMV